MSDEEVLPELTEKPKTTTIVSGMTVQLEATGTIRASAVAQLSITAFQKPPKDHLIYALIGQVSCEWTHLEHLLDQIIWEASRQTQQEGHCITGQIVGAAPRLFAIIALLLFHKKSDALVNKAREILGTTQGLYEKRNRIVHDAWYVVAGTPEVQQKKGMPRNELGSKRMKDITIGIQPTYDTAAVEAIIAEIQSKAAEIATFRDDVVRAMRVA